MKARIEWNIDFEKYFLIFTVQKDFNLELITEYLDVNQHFVNEVIGIAYERFDEHVFILNKLPSKNDMVLIKLTHGLTVFDEETFNTELEKFWCENEIYSGVVKNNEYIKD